MRIEPTGFQGMESLFLLLLLGFGVFDGSVLLIIISLMLIVFLHPHWQSTGHESETF